MADLGQINQFQTDYMNFMNQNKGTSASAANTGANLTNSGLAIGGQAVNNAEGAYNPDAVRQAQAGQQKGISDYSSMVSGLYNNPGYTADEKNQMNLAVTAPTSAAYNTAAEQNSRQAAQTGNEGAAMASNDELARQKARDLTSGLSGLQTQFANARIQGQQFATGAQAQVPTMQNQLQETQQQNNAQLTPLTSAYLGAGGTATGQGITSQGQQVPAMGQEAQLSLRPGFWQTLASGLSGVASKL